MKIWWRQQEMVFAISILVIAFIAQLGYADQRALLFDSIATYSYYRNTLLPFLLSFGAPVVLLILINGWLLPYFQSHRFRWWVFGVTAITSWLLLTRCFSSFYYYHYYPNIEKTGEMKYLIQSRRFGLMTGTLLLVVYLAYFAFRESIISWLERTKDKYPLRVMVCNRITLVAFLYILLFILFVMFDIFRSDGPFMAYIFILLPVIIASFINIYLILPYQQKTRLTAGKKLLQLSIAPFSLSIAAFLIYFTASGHLFLNLLPVSFILTMILATPLSLLFYAQQREKINALLALEQKLGKTRADLAFLRSQINPHFLFNTLNTLYGTALQEQASRTATGIQRLGDMMRFLLHDNNRESIPVTREIEYLRHYISLQSLRIAEVSGIRIETSISEMDCNYSIAPMLLIPFVENAFKHGIRLTKPSFILIKLFCDNEGIHLDVVNSRHPDKIQDNEEGYSGVGLENVKKRLELLYPASHSLQLHEDDAAFQIHLFIRP